MFSIVRGTIYFSAAKEEKGTEEQEGSGIQQSSAPNQTVEIKVTEATKEFKGKVDIKPPPKPALQHIASPQAQQAESTSAPVKVESTILDHEESKVLQTTVKQSPQQSRQEEPKAVSVKAETSLSQKENRTGSTGATQEKQTAKPLKVDVSLPKQASEEVVSKPQGKVESSSSSSSSTLRQSSFAVLTTTTTTSEAETETLKQVQTPESETVDDGSHFKRIRAVEPLIQINKPRVLEEVLPYIIKPPPELIPGSAIEKVYSFEKQGESNVILTDYHVGIEVNVEVGNEMSRRYTSSTGKFHMYHCCSQYIFNQMVKNFFTVYTATSI